EDRPALRPPARAVEAAHRKCRYSARSNRGRKPPFGYCRPLLSPKTPEGSGYGCRFGRPPGLHPARGGPSMPLDRPGAAAEPPPSGCAVRRGAGAGAGAPRACVARTRAEFRNNASIAASTLSVAAAANTAVQPPVAPLSTLAKGTNKEAT